MNEPINELIVEDKQSGIYRSIAKKEIPLPKIPFEKFWQLFGPKGELGKTIGDLKATDEWKNIFSNYYDFSDIDDDTIINESAKDIEKYDAARQTEEIIKCANSFAYFCIKYVKIRHPKYGLINLVPYSYQRRVIDCYGKHRFNILSKFRQGGLTTISVAWALWRCMFKTGQQIMVVSKTDREAIGAGGVAKNALEKFPSWLKPEMEEDNKHEKHFQTTGSVLYFYTVLAARGKSITILIIDEAAFIPDMDEHWAALYPVISTGGACEVISTVHGQGNWYERTYHDAEKGANDFSIIDLDYWEHPLYNDPEWIRITRANLTDKKWAQEIERSFLGSGDTWLNAKILTAITQSTRDNIPKRMIFEQWMNKDAIRMNAWDKGAMWVWKEPVDGHEYIIGGDAAEGVGETGDNSCFQVIDSATLEQVAEFYSNSIPPHVFAQILHKIGYYYNTALVVVESLNQGVAVLSTLEHELYYENIFSEDFKGNATGVKTSKSKRPIFLQSLQQKLLNGMLKVNSPRLATEFATFLFNAITKKPEAQRGSHDDAIMALALAIYVRELNMRGIPPGSEMPEEMLQVFKSEAYKEIENEIYNISIEEHLLHQELDELTILTQLEQTMPGFVPVKRKNDDLLKEFGW